MVITNNDIIFFIFIYFFDYLYFFGHFAISTTSIAYPNTKVKPECGYKIRVVNPKTPSLYPPLLPHFPHPSTSYVALLHLQSHSHMLYNAFSLWQSSFFLLKLLQIVSCALS